MEVKEIRVLTNTYPETDGVPHGKPGDICEWKLVKGAFRLIRKNDGKCVFSTPPVNKDGLKSNGRPPDLLGVIGEVKSKGWIFEVAPIIKKYFRKKKWRIK